MDGPSWIYQEIPDSGHPPIYEIILDGVERRSGNEFIADSVYGEDNARLMAAAPDLLMAIKKMVHAYREGCADDDWPSVADALKAIAKAEG